MSTNHLLGGRGPELPVTERAWAMPSANTFSIPVIEELVRGLVDLGGHWIDPFANTCRLAHVTNDLNPDHGCDFSMDALDFLRAQPGGDATGGVLFDPPYSQRQIKEQYQSVGHTAYNTKSSFWGALKDEIARVCAPGAHVVTCAWNSGGIGASRGFQRVRTLLVSHGGWHNDTIVTVEQKA